MKKTLVFAIAFLSLASCQSLETSLVGSYYTDTIDGILYLELMPDGDCIAYFQGGDENAGFWHITDDNGIRVSVTAEIDKNGWKASYRIGFPQGDGEIYESRNFSIPAKRLYRGDSKEISLTFKRR